MKTCHRNRMAVAALGACVVMSGCQTTGGTSDQAVGAGIGAALGCGIGLLAGGQAKYCLAGAAAGGLLGWGVVALSEYNARQVRTTSADQRIYGLTGPVDSTQIKIRKGSSAPKKVKPGQGVKISTDYSVILPPNESGVNVTESWTLKKDGQVLMDFAPQTNRRTAGGWNADAEIPIPSDAKPGTYVVLHKVKAGSAYDEDESTFTVRS